MPSPLLTLDEAITQRLQEKRRSQEEAARILAEQRAEEDRRCQIIASLFKSYIETLTQVSLDGIKINLSQNHNSGYHARFDTEDGSITFYPAIYLNDLDGKAWKGRGKAAIDIAPYKNREKVWRASFGHYYAEFSDLIEAFIYIKFGTTNPDLMSIEVVNA